MNLFDIITQQLANSLVLGSFYGLVAIGYSLVYGIIKLLNFAHGDIYMVGAFIGFGILSLLSGFLGAGWVGIAVSLILSMIATGFLGVLIQRLAYRPMLAAPRLSIMITALGVSLVLFNTVMAITNGQYLAFNTDLGFEEGGDHDRQAQGGQHRTVGQALDQDPEEAGGDHGQDQGHGDPNPARAKEARQQGEDTEPR